ncbi:MAG: RNA polymerase sigma factor [Clostridia bacterium]
MSKDLQEQYDKIYNFCYFRVKNREIAEDLTQETFLKYFSYNSYIEKGKPLALLYTIAKNNCNDYFRLKQTDELDENLSEDTQNETDINITIKTAVLNLSFDEQEIIMLRFTNELGILEIAKYLNISRFAVNRKIKTVLKKLKLDLKEEDFYG